MNDEFKLVPIGEIIKPHGIKGELKILLYNEESRSLKIDKFVYIEDDNDLSKYKIEKINYSFKKNRIKFFEINSKGSAEYFRGRIIKISRSELPELDNDEYYLCDLIDFTVVDEKHNKYGTVQDVLHLPANDVLSVLFRKEEYLIPMISDVLVKVDTKLKLIVINPIEGLFD